MTASNWLRAHQDCAAAYVVLASVRSLAEDDSANLCSPAPTASPADNDWGRQPLTLGGLDSELHTRTPGTGRSQCRDIGIAPWDPIPFSSGDYRVRPGGCGRVSWLGRSPQLRGAPCALPAPAHAFDLDVDACFQRRLCARWRPCWLLHSRSPARALSGSWRHLEMAVSSRASTGRCPTRAGCRHLLARGRRPGGSPPRQTAASFMALTGRCAARWRLGSPGRGVDGWCG